MAISMAPGLKQLLVYEGPSADLALSGDVLNAIASDDLANQISSSWAVFDSVSFSQIFQQMGAQGQSFFQASGDQGAFNWVTTQFQQHTDNPYITLVGGTELTVSGVGGAWQSETVLNDNRTGDRHRCRRRRDQPELCAS